VTDLLRIEDLHTQFHVHGGTVKAVDGVNLTIPAKATVGLVGESGSGKSITALSIMRLLEKNGRITGGHVWFRDQDLVALTDQEMQEVRGNDISMIFQEPMTALNPVYTCGDQIAEAVQLHGKVDAKAAFDRAIEVLRLVGISDPKRRARQYPHELSGGMRQRVALARALANDPQALLFDEPLAALDSQTRRVMQDELLRIWAETGKTFVYVTHSLQEAVLLGSRIVLMTAGPGRIKRVEEVTLPRPRHLTGRAEAALLDRLDALLGEEVQRAMAS
jgi:ABC-type dipeptide/oligopeptide/nickel transport system ATPase component